MRKLTTAGAAANFGVICFFLILMLLISATTVKLAYGGSSATALAGAELYMEINGAKIPISLVPQDLKFPQLIPYFGPDNPGSRFRPLHDILLYGNKFTIGDLQKGLNGRTFKENQLIKVTNPEALKEVITVIYNEPVNGKNSNTRDERFQQKGYLITRAVNDSTSLDAFNIMLLLANKMGAKFVHVTRQGVDFSMYAVGYGVSLVGVTGTLSESQQSGAVATGMLGWTKGKSGANKDPWLQGLCLEPLP